MIKRLLSNTIINIKLKIMNKKFSTLVAGILLAGSFPILAQNAHLANGEVTYRSQFVKSASLDQGFFGVKNIEAGKWYQLAVNMADDAKANEATYVLTQERDYSTGRLYLAVKPIQDAVLSHSLWKIQRVGQEVNGSIYTFTNKETGYTLTFNHEDAALLTAGDLANMETITDAATQAAEPIVRTLKKGDPSVIRGCATNWAWYTNQEQTNHDFNSKLLYTYFHADNKTASQDSIMALAMVKVGPDSDIRYDAEHYYVKTVKASAKAFADADLYDTADKKKLALVHIRPVVAGAKVLNADEVNSMIDADGTSLDFAADNAKYPGYTRDNVTRDFAKFTLLSPKTGQPITVYNNPFDTAWIAKTSDFGVLDRRNFNPKFQAIAGAPTAADFNGNANAYAGYNLLFQNNKDKSKYLKVWDELYETEEGGNYNALKVAGAPYTYTGAREMTSDEARYHWKATYYATNDSLVLEPLNASRHNYEGENIALTVPQYLNTVNAAKAFSTNSGESNAYNKAAGVPVALYLQNLGPAAGDVKGYLTVGSPNGLNTYVDKKYAAAPKFDATTIAYPQKYFYTDYEQNEKLYLSGAAQANTVWMVAGNNPAYVTNGASYRGMYTTAKAKDVKDVDIDHESPKGANVDATTVDYNSLYAGTITATQWLRLTFDSEYTPLIRDSYKDALYFIQLKTDKPLAGNGSRINNAYLVYNHVGRLMYATPNENQDFGIMPSAQWVIKQKPCLNKSDINKNATPEVQIFNREYGKGSYAAGEEVPVFEGQLYQTTIDGVKYNYIINHRDYYNVARANGTFTMNTLTCSDTLLISEVDPEKYAEAYESKYHGYKHMDFHTLAESANQPYYLKYNDKHSDDLTTNTDKYLYSNASGYLAVTNPDNADFINQKNLFEIETIEPHVPYGYSDIKGLEPLNRTVYALKVRDNNVIDNNRKYVVVLKDAKNNQRYAVRELKEINGQDVKIAEFYLKADELTSDKTDTCYVLVDVRSYDNVSGKNAANAINLNNDIFKVKNDLDADVSKTLSHLHVFNENAPVSHALYNDAADRKFINNGWQILEMVNDPDKLYPYAMDNEPNYDWSAFQLVRNIRPLYKPVAEDREVNGNINIVVNDGIGGVKQALFEMSKNQYADITNAKEGINYAGVTSEGIKPGKGWNTSIYVDSVVTSPLAPVAMPQYMLWVANDTIADGFYCEDYLEAPGHGYFDKQDAADAEDMEHYVYYNGYVSGRMLINFNDSVALYTGLNKLDEASRFKYNNRTRLGFVEGVHMVITVDELLTADKKAFKDGAEKYFPKADFAQLKSNLASLTDQELVYVLRGTTLADIRDTKGFINPKKLNDAINAGQIDVKYLNGTHRNYVWALRYTEDEITDPSIGEGTGRGHNDFLLESFDQKDGVAGKASIGGYKGAWVKLDNNVPVLARITTTNGDHDDLGATDISEGLNQGQIFNMTVTEDYATSTDEVSVSAVKVFATTGAVIIKGAEGKKVTISNVLGQAVASTVITSSEAPISVPAGVVFVAVEGEVAVKAIVK